MKNIVFIVDVKLKGSGRWAGTRSDPYKFSIDSWKSWCNKNNCELFVLTEEILPHAHMPISWQRYYIFDLLEANGIEYDQILYVDADTIVHPDAPNIFEISDRKFCFVHNEGSYDWVLRSMENYSKMFVTTPAPTVRPPSRIAKRKPSSMAIGAISSTLIRMLSPGITISRPSVKKISPVTSVVRK